MKVDPLHHILEYFAYFSYPPTLEEIHTFIGTKISQTELKKLLDEEVKKNRFEAQGKPVTRYAFSGKSTFFEQNTARSTVSERKIKKVAKYLEFLNRLPFLLLTGISGSVSMKNAKETDDVDLFIITIPNRLWTARFWAVIIAFLMGLKRNRGDRDVAGKICLNLFFDGADIKVPEHKRNEYVAHEVLQMKPLMNRSGTFERFLAENSWVKDYFPNAVVPQKSGIPAVRKVGMWGGLGNTIEWLLGWVQMIIMQGHRTKEIISPTQLWFYPKDFQITLKKHVPIRQDS